MLAPGPRPYSKPHQFGHSSQKGLAEAAGLALPLEKAEDVALANRALKTHSVRVECLETGATS